MLQAFHGGTFLMLPAACRTVAFVVLSVAAHAAFAEPLAERFMLDGKLAEGETALATHLKTSPDDDQARFGLGAIRFLLAFEHLGTSLHAYGLRTERAFPGIPQEVRELVPQNDSPQELSNEDARRIVQTFLDDVVKAEATLATITTENVKLPLHVALVRIDFFGQGTPVNAAFILDRMQADVPADALNALVVAFDRGDACWLRGYCHFLAAGCELILAVDTREIFECTAHLFFEKVKSPHRFLQDEPRNLSGLMGWDVRLISDVIAFIHLLRFPLHDAQRMQASLEHLEAMIDQSETMWVHYRAETDNDNEWIPNPKQDGVMQVEVTEDRMQAWLDTVAEFKQVVKGTKLLPFWRGANPARGVNLRRVFTEPQTIDPILWIQGTAATPYLEEGPITEFAAPEMLRRLSNTFGGTNFFGFAFWFN